MTGQMLVFDVGTTGTKAALMTAEGSVLSSAYSDYETRTPQEGIVEQNAEDWWQAVLETASQLDFSQVTGIAITGQMQNVILLDEDAEVIRPVILYSDMRAQNESEFVNQTLRHADLKSLTGNEQTASFINL